MAAFGNDTGRHSFFVMLKEHRGPIRIGRVSGGRPHLEAEARANHRARAAAAALPTANRCPNRAAWSLGVSRLARHPCADRVPARGRNVRGRQSRGCSRCRGRWTGRRWRRRPTRTRRREVIAGAGQVHAPRSAAARATDTAAENYAARCEEAAQASREAQGSADGRADAAGGGAICECANRDRDCAVGGSGYRRDCGIGTRYRRWCRRRERPGPRVGQWSRYGRRRGNRLSCDA